MNIHPTCSVCGLHFAGAREGDTWAWMYFSTAFMTGWVILGMFLYRPESIILGLVIVILAALGLMFGTLPFRKGLAFAMDYWIELKTDPEGEHPYRPSVPKKNS